MRPLRCTPSSPRGLLFGFAALALMLAPQATYAQDVIPGGYVSTDKFLAAAADIPPQKPTGRDQEETSSPPASRGNALTSALARARVALGVGNLSTAETLIQAVLHQEPGQPEARVLEICLDRRRGQLDLAVQKALKLRQAHAGEGWSWRLLALLHLEAGASKEALLDAREALRLEPGVADGYTLSGHALYDLARLALAADEATDPSQSLQGAEFLHQAQAQFETACSMTLTDISPQLGLARVFRLQGHATQARAILNAALQVHPKSAELYSAIAEYDLEVGDLVGAREAVEQALTLAPATLHYRVQRAQVLYREGNAGPANHEAAEVLLKNPDCQPGLVLRGSLLRDAGELVRARQDLETALALNKLDSGVHAALGTLYLLEESYEAAGEQLTLAVRLGNRDSATRNNLGIALRHQARYQEAVEQFQKSLYLDPAQADVYYNLAIALDLGGQSKQAVEPYTRYLQLIPDAPEAKEISERLREIAGH